MPSPIKLAMDYIGVTPDNIEETVYDFAHTVTAPIGNALGDVVPTIIITAAVTVGFAYVTAVISGKRK
jgi:hypothetical protein